MTDKNCSFCGKSKKEVNKLIMGQALDDNEVYICDGCVDLCKQVLDKSISKTKVKKSKRIPYPHEIFKRLDEFVIGQDEAKKSLSIAAHNHYKRIQNNENQNSKVRLTKSNLLLIGSTGTGKTLLAQSLAEILDVPFAITDATSLTEAGYVGEDVESIISRLVQNSEDVVKAQKGIIYIDEIDKIAKKSDNPSLTRDVTGEGVQQALLKLVEGYVAHISPNTGRKHPNQELLDVDTTDILFIAGGAFSGLDKIIEKRKSGTKGIGFGANLSEKTEVNWSEVEPQDLKKFGLIPEFIGRFPIVVTLDDLDLDEMVRIIKEPKNNLIDQFKSLFLIDEIELEFTDESLKSIAKECLIRKTGARGLRSVFERILKDLQFNIGNMKEEGVSKILITEETIKGKPPILFHHENLDNLDNHSVLK